MQKINVPSDLLTASLLVTVTPGHWGKSQTRSTRNEGKTDWFYFSLLEQNHNTDR